MSWGCYVYAIGPEHGEAIKVGIAADPRQRLKQLQTGNPQRLSILRRWGPMDRAEAQRIEADMHFLLGDFRESGEWFSVCAQGASVAMWAVAEIPPGSPVIHDYRKSVVHVVGVIRQGKA